IVQDFTELSPTEADELLSNEEGTIVFIGRPTCPYCRKFAPKLHKVSTEHKVQVNFVNSEHPDYTNELKDFREKYGVPTDRKSTRLNSSHVSISYAVFCLTHQEIKC